MPPPISHFLPSNPLPRVRLQIDYPFSGKKLAGGSLAQESKNLFKKTKGKEEVETKYSWILLRMPCWSQNASLFSGFLSFILKTWVGFLALVPNLGEVEGAEFCLFGNF
ncbi:uncharacterized protein G2W53_020690 [Senna tora]|uniref:Uncharacterized protein n=1 Tax=Senna tora TaxID=362788 RepID=A0A834WKD5_9FABA|nr:uncharacterized protein G2W53_020690 [Senna tora]